jgi:hypothetical protein
MDARNFEADAELARLGFERLGLAARQQGTASLITGAGSIADKWETFNRATTKPKAKPAPSSGPVPGNPSVTDKDFSQF